MVRLQGRKWVARWQENGIEKRVPFDNEQEAIKCENENKVKIKERKKRKETKQFNKKS